MTTKQQALLTNWNDLVRTIRRMEQTVLELARHPEATSEQLLEASTKYGMAYRNMRDKQPTVEKALAHYHHNYKMMKV